MSKFLTSLRVEELEDNCNEGRGNWKLLSPFIYYSSFTDKIYTVPIGFITDFASVPRLPLVFWLFGEVTHEAAVVHDYLYRTPGIETKSNADIILKEAMSIDKISWYKSYPIYLSLIHI